MDQVRFIFLDAGGVLFETFIKQGERIRRILTERGYPKAAVDAAILKAKQGNHMPFITNWKEEKHYYTHYYGSIAEELGDGELTHELLYFAHYAGHCELFPEVKEALELLKSKYRLGIISNAMPSMDWIFDWLGLRKYFESIILSAHVNAAKPDRAIYHFALNQLHATKEESIFIDDKLVNIDAAEKVGIKGFHLDRDKQNLVELIKSIGL